MQETLACLVIDDPLLRPRYGCLDYEALLREMQAHRFFTEIAFIPWNYKRSDPGTVRLLADNPEYYSVCVHGCNHVAAEFGGRSYQRLSALASTALWRMEQHTRMTGLPYDPVMVFPQGRFSSVAMKALRDQGFVAACNSTIRAVDGDEPPAVEELQPATTLYHDFPLFLRRYPTCRADFVRDFECGRPIIVVEHHGAFRSGYSTITDLVDWVNTLGTIRWTSLLQIAEYYLGRKAAVARPVADACPPDALFDAKVRLRRFLCEARDNYIETNRPLNKVYMTVRARWTPER